MWNSLLLFCLFYSTMGLSTLPVFLFDFDKTITYSAKTNPLQKMSPKQFEDVIERAINKNLMILVFIEESLSMEDITAKDNTGSPYSFLRNSLKLGNVKYIPSVVSPYKTLTKTLPKLLQNTFYLSITNSHTFRIHNKLKHAYIQFVDDFNQSRINNLKEHDVVMKAVCTLVRQVSVDPVIAFYTGKKNPMTIKKTASRKIADKESDTTDVTIASDAALFRLLGVYTAVGARRSTFTQVPEVTDERWQNKKLITRMSYLEFEIEFTFTMGDKQWTIGNSYCQIINVLYIDKVTRSFTTKHKIKLPKLGTRAAITDDVALLEGGEEVGKTKIEGGAPKEYSFFCGEPIVLVNTRDGSTVTISRYQVQPFYTNPMVLRRGDSNEAMLRRIGQNKICRPGTKCSRRTTGDTDEKNKTNEFGNVIHCAPYFPSSVLACLFVTCICLTILTYGIISMFDIHSNDRYDDPQGNPLVIASEQ